VTLAPRATTSNYDATWITQSYSEDERPLSAHGLHGSGMVLAEADSGLDYFSCFFYDSEVEVTFDNQGLYRDKVGGDLGSGWDPSQGDLGVRIDKAETRELASRRVIVLAARRIIKPTRRNGK
jgi:hypothetical protein